MQIAGRSVSPPPSRAVITVCQRVIHVIALLEGAIGVAK